MSTKYYLAGIATMCLFIIAPASSSAATTVAQNRVDFQNSSRFTQSSTSASSTKEKRDRTRTASSTVNRTCMAQAVVTREEKVTVAWTQFSEAINTALEKRSTALGSAWNGSKEGSRDAIKKSWADWKAEKRAAHLKLRTDRKTAWTDFKKTAKDTCKVTTPKEEGLEQAGSDSIAL